MFNLLRQLSSATFRKGGSVYKLQSATQCTVAKTRLSPAFISVSPFKSIPSIDAVPYPKGRKSSVLDQPLSENKLIREIPLIPNISYLDIINWNIAVEEPTKVVEKQAARLIVIRRRKMKRHKLKKLRVKMKFEWAKVRQRRELRKEKAFQAELMGKIKEAEKFDPVVYAANKINKANEVLTPKLWRGKRLPEFLIKELIVESNRKKAKKLEKIERRKKISLKVSDYNV